jgi:hypothetical protein
MQILLIERALLLQDLKIFFLREIHLQSIDFEGTRPQQENTADSTIKFAQHSSLDCNPFTVIIFDSNSESIAAPPEPAI